MNPRTEQFQGTTVLRVWYPNRFKRIHWIWMSGCLLFIFMIDATHALAQEPFGGDSPTATDVYVDRTNISGIEDGSQSNPFNTIIEGVAAVSDSGTVWIGPGYYAEPLTLATGKRVFLKASDHEVTVGAQNTDRDGDALPDAWEINGYDDGDNGSIDVDLPALGAHPLHKDIFVEVDYMVQAPTFPGDTNAHSHQPNANAIQTIVNAFNNAPISNPDGTNGIHLHVDYGPAAPLSWGSVETWGTLSGANQIAHQQNISTCNSSNDFSWTGFNTLRSNNFSTIRQRIFHYNIWAHSLCASKASISGTSRDFGASDFIVSLGAWTAQIGTADQQAGTFMHELGHNLGLHHGGGDEANFKPNYLSVMNYLFQTDGLIVNNNWGTFDYSHYRLDDLDENSLNENDGLRLPPTETRTVGTYYFCGGGQWLVYNAQTVDWNCNLASSDMGISMDVNNDGALGILAGYDDWQNLTFDGGLIPEGPGFSLLPNSTVVDELDAPTDVLLPSPQQPTNSVPQLQGDQVTMTANDSIVLTVLDNDEDSDGDALVIFAVGTPAHGTATTDGTTITYTPDAEFNGTDTFTYSATDSRGGTTTTNVTVIVVAAARQHKVLLPAIVNQ